MKFLVDAHLPPSLCRLLRQEGHDAIHTLELPDQNRTPDGELIQVALRQHRVLVSKDTDFYYSHLLSGRPPKLLLIRTGNMRIRDFLDLFEKHLPAVIEALESNSLVELDRSAIRIVV